MMSMILIRFLLFSSCFVEVLFAIRLCLGWVHSIDLTPSLHQIHSESFRKKLLSHECIASEFFLSHEDIFKSLSVL